MALDAMPVTPKQLGDYDVLNKIAEGGMGAVFRARHRISGLIVAIKVLPPATAKNPILLRRFELEFRAAAALDHPNIVRAVEYCGTGPSPFLVMEFVDGESLGNLIDKKGPMEEDAAIRIIAQVCQGLHKAHKLKLVHRDVKPDNVMVTVDGVAKLTDMGLVKDADNETNLTKTGRGLGTPNFMAPEQFRDAKNADVRCDVYSLGATLYTMLTGEVPFGKVGPLDCWMRKVRNELVAPREINPKITERVDWAIRRSMSGDPEKRPNSCKEFIEDLTGVSIRPPGAPEQANTQDIWYLVYRDDEGINHTVKGNTDGIRKALKDGLLGDAGAIRAGRTKQGQFLGLHQFPEFRDLVIEPAPMATPGGTAQSQSLRNTPPANKSRTSSESGRPDPEAVDFAAGRRGAGQDAPTTAYRASTDDVEDRPHFRMGKERPKNKNQPEGTDWVMWAVVMGVAVLVALLAVFLLPKFKF